MSGHQALLNASLLVAIEKESRADISRLLRSGADPNAFHSESSNAFIEALRAGMLEAAEEMIDCGADVNAQCEPGRTAPPLMAAALRDAVDGGTRRVDFLLARGADAGRAFVFLDKPCITRTALEQCAFAFKPRERAALAEIARRLDLHQTGPQRRQRQSDLRENSRRRKGQFKL